MENQEKSKADSKIVYQNSEILKLSDDDHSFVKPLAIVRVWRRKIIKIEGKSVSPKHVKLMRPVYDTTLLLKARNRSKALETRASMENVTAKILSLLNKLAPSNRVKLQQKLLEISLGSEENLKVLVEKIFQKACLEKKYTSMWADLCVFLVDNYKSPVEKGNRFRSELLNMSQLLFEHFESDSSPSWLDKKKMMGNLSFVAELFKNRVIPKKTISHCLESLIGGEINEDRVEGAAVLILNCGKTCLQIGESLEKILQKFKEMVSANIISSRIKFLLIDVLEAKDRGFEALDN